MTAPLHFELEWMPPFEESSAEGLTFAELKLRLGDFVITEVEDLVAQTLRDQVFVSAYPLALFMAENWWRLRWEPATGRVNAAWRLRHCLSAVGDGYSWPNLEFASDGEAIHVQMWPSSSSDVAQVRYVVTRDGWISADEFERSVDQMLDAVKGRLDAIGHDDSDLAGLIGELRAERSDAEMTRWRRLEALAGYDPDEAPEAFIRNLLAEEGSIGWASLQELAASSRHQAVQDLAILREALNQRGTRFGIAELDDLRTAAAVSATENVRPRPPWLRGAEAAHRARQHFGLNGEVVSSRRLAEIFDMPESILETGDPSHAPFSASVHSEEEGRSQLVLSKPLDTSRRFAVSRLLGDRLYSNDGEDRLSAATEAGTARQKFQRSFAQEFLCPFEALGDVLDSDSPSYDDLDSAAEHFQVSPLLIRTTLVNRNILPRDILDLNY